MKPTSVGRKKASAADQPIVAVAAEERARDRPRLRRARVYTHSEESVRPGAVVRMDGKAARRRATLTR